MLTIDPVSAAVALVLELPLLLAAGLGPREFWLRTLPIWIAAPLAAVTIALYGAASGEVYVEWFVVRISEGSLTLALATFFRVLAIGLPAVVLFVTVDPTDLADGLAQLLRCPPASCWVRSRECASSGCSPTTGARSRSPGVLGASPTPGACAACWAWRSPSSSCRSVADRLSPPRWRPAASAGAGARTWARESRFGWREWMLLAAGAAISTTAVTVAVVTGSWNFILGPV